MRNGTYRTLSPGVGAGIIDTGCRRGIASCSDSMAVEVQRQALAKHVMISIGDERFGDGL